MKKSIIIFAILTVLLLSACQFGDNNETLHNNSVTPSVPAPTEPAPTETTPTEPEKNVEEYFITSATEFSDGVAFVHCRDDDGIYFDAAIDTNGEILYILPDDWKISIGEYHNGNLVVGNDIYDIYGNLIASPEMSGYDELLTINRDGYILATKREESFAGDKICFGVLGSNGEWIYPLSSDNPISQMLESDSSYMDDWSVWDDDYGEYGTYIVRISVGWGLKYYYNLSTNELCAGYVHYESRNYQGQKSGIYLYDTSGERKLVIPNISADRFFNDAFIGSNLAEYDKRNLYDYNGNIIMDLSQYDLDCYSACYKNGYLLIKVDNRTGSKYLCLFNPNGELAFDPIRMGRGDSFYGLIDEGFVYEYEHEDGYTKSYYFYDYAGNKTEYMDMDGFYGFSDGLGLVEFYDKNYYRIYCYINTEGKVVIDSIEQEN